MSPNNVIDLLIGYRRRGLRRMALLPTRTALPPLTDKEVIEQSNIAECVYEVTLDVTTAPCHPRHEVTSWIVIYAVTNKTVCAYISYVHTV